MTGFGASSTVEVEGAELRVEVRSVNHRHLQLKTRAPSELTSLEPRVERRVRRELERGSVSVFVHAAKVPGSEALAIDESLAARYSSQARKLAGKLELEGGLGLDTLLSLPGVVAGEGAPRAPRAVERLEKKLLTLVDEAVGRLVEMRTAEGRALEADLRKHAAALNKVVARIEKRMPKVVSAHRDNLHRRVKELLGGHDLEPADLAREVALLADRLDVSEELSRLESHLDQLAGFLDKGGRVGRKLDFLVQEIFREVNTIGSKCSDAKVAHWVVEAKTLVERLREQVQNVE